MFSSQITSTHCTLLFILFASIASTAGNDCPTQPEMYCPSSFVNNIFNFSDIKGGLYEIKITNATMQDETILAYGNFNRTDQYVGIITRDRSLKKLYLYMWDGSNYIKMSNVCSGQNEYCSKDILNAIPIDWDYNGYLDLIIIADDSDVEGDQAFEAHFLLQNPADNGSASECTLSRCQLVNDFSISLNTNAQPFIIPLQQQDQHMHGLLYFSKDEGQRVVVTYNPNSNSQSTPVYDKLTSIMFSTLVDFSSPQCTQLSPSNYFEVEFAKIHFSSVVDLNGDCRNDIFIHSQQTVNNQVQNVFEIYVRQEDGSLCLTEVYVIPPQYEVQALGFTDVNFDGSLDIVVVYIEQGNTSQSIMQIGFNNIVFGAQEACSKNGVYSKIFSDLTNLSSSTANVLILRQAFQLIKPTATTFPSLRFGDFNLDGYTDLLMTVITSQDSLPYSYFFENSPCDLPECGNLAADNQRYFMQQNSDPKFALISKQPSISASFFDFNENGQLDIILNTIQTSITGTTLSITPIYNYLRTGTYFIKAFVMNGAQTGEAGEDNTGSNMYGATVVCKVTTIEGQLQPTKGAQLYQSAYIPLQLPYVVLGIARTNNYINDLTIGLGTGNGNTIRGWNPIIPNSQINFYPYTQNPAKWNVSAYMSNAVETELAIFIIACSLLIIFGVIIFYLYTKQKAQDKTEVEVENLLI